MGGGGRGGGDDTRVVTSEGGSPPGHEVFFDDGMVRGILRRVSASMLTARARASRRPSNHPPKQRVRSPVTPRSVHPPRDFVDGILPPPPPPMEVSDQRALTTKQIKTILSILNTLLYVL